MRKNFDIKYKDDILSGKMSVVTRDGRDVYILDYNTGSRHRPIEAIIDGIHYMYKEDGTMFEGEKGDMDLLLEINENGWFERKWKSILNARDILVNEYRKGYEDGTKELSRKWIKVSDNSIFHDIKACVVNSNLYLDGYYISISELEKTIKK